jgi:transposase-like protein
MKQTYLQFPGPGQARHSVAAIQSYLDHVTGGLSMRSLARKEGVQPSTISRRISRIEDARDNKSLDDFLTRAASLSEMERSADFYAEFTVTPPRRTVTRRLTAAQRASADKTLLSALMALPNLSLPEKENA